MIGVSLMFGMTSAIAQDQDPGAAAAQQATQLAQQHMQQMQDENAARANAQFQQQMQDSANAAQQNNTPLCCLLTAVPTFSVKPGKYSQALQVKIRDRTRGATIYYTTDGWTPSTASAKYTGPVEIGATTQLQAIALGPTPLFARSLVAKAQYTLTLSGVPAAVPSQAIAGLKQGLDAPAILSQDSMETKSSGSPTLLQGTQVRLVFVTSVNSKTADVGDKIQLKLVDDIKDGNTVLVAKGAKAQATVTEADRTGPAGLPGNVVFQVNSMNVDGKTIPLNGTATLEGDPKQPNAAVLIPVVGLFTLLRHGKDAEIKAGTPVTAYIAANTSLSSQ
jgi:hypothetical protein